MKKILLYVLDFIVGIFVGIAATGKQAFGDMKKEDEKLQKMHKFYNLLVCWLQKKQEGKSIVEYLNGQGYKRIVIYGMKELGELLLHECKDSDIDVVCIVDKNPNIICDSIKVVRPEEELPEADVMIVTAVFHYSEIEQNMRNRINFQIESLENIIFQM